MPELPEVETVVKELRKKITREVFSEFTSLWPKSFVSDKNLSLINREIIKISRKGKYILIKLDQNYLLTHLRMTGQLIVTESLPENTNHLRLIFKFVSGKFLLFFDLRKFGRVYHTATPDLVLKNIGIDALSKELDLQTFRDLVKDRKTSVKSFLLNQKYIAGFGNIYIDESLFRAKIHPQSRLSDLSSTEIRILFDESRKVLLKSISRMGSTISDYKTTGGGFGTNQNYFKIYKREGFPCCRCKSTIKKSKVAGRGTHYCPNCQEMKD